MHLGAVTTVTSPIAMKQPHSRTNLVTLRRVGWNTGEKSDQVSGWRIAAGAGVHTPRGEFDRHYRPNVSSPVSRALRLPMGGAHWRPSDQVTPRTIWAIRLRHPTGVTREQAHLPAEHPPTVQDARLSPAHAHPRWPLDHRLSPPQGPREADGLIRLVSAAHVAGGASAAPTGAVHCSASQPACRSQWQ